MRWTCHSGVRALTWALLTAAPAVGRGTAFAFQSISHPKVSPALEFREGTEDVEVYLVDETGKPPPDCTILESVVDSIGAEKVLTRVCPEGFVARLTRDEALALAQNERVEGVWPNLKLYPMLHDAVEIIHAIDTWDIEVNGVPLTGEGWTVAIGDTGVDFTHPDLAPKNVGGGNFNCVDGADCPLEVDPSFSNSHGTHVAGIAGAAGEVSGVAVGADLISLRVFPQGDDHMNSIYIIRAIRWAIEHADEYRIAAVSISVGTINTYPSYCDQLHSGMTSAINDAADAGIAVVFSAGNAGSHTGISYPACISNAIPVAATNKNDYVASYSNYNAIVKLFAPGSSIYSTCFHGDHCYKSGTSMAAPMVSGSIALIRQFLDAIGVSLHPLEIEEVLFDTGEEAHGVDPEHWRRINVEYAIRALIEAYACPEDIDTSWNVGVEDLFAVLAVWGPCEDCPEDFDGSGDVGFGDLLRVLETWGPCP